VPTATAMRLRLHHRPKLCAALPASLLVLCEPRALPAVARASRLSSSAGRQRPRYVAQPERSA
jgi:hypothetical protein